MGTIGSNIELCNLHIKKSCESLKTKGQSIDNLILKLYTGYKEATDSKFVEYIKTKEELYLDVTNLEADELMQLVLIKYSTRKQHFEWGASSLEKETKTREIILTKEEVSKEEKLGIGAPIIKV